MGKRSLNGKSEALMLRSQAHRTTPPEELFKKISSESGVCNVCTVAAITTLATCFYKELDTRGAILIPGIGFFWKEMVPGRAMFKKMVIEIYFYWQCIGRMMFQLTRMQIEQLLISA